MPGPVKRRASLPGASELFRPTREPAPADPPRPRESQPADKSEVSPRATGRVGHSQKITVYFSDDELIALEDANGQLRREHGIRVDRGRIVRLAVSRAIADLMDNGGESFLVSELTQR